MQLRSITDMVARSMEQSRTNPDFRRAHERSHLSHRAFYVPFRVSLSLWLSHTVQISSTLNVPNPPIPKGTGNRLHPYSEHRDSDSAETGGGRAEARGVCLSIIESPKEQDGQFSLREQWTVTVNDEGRWRITR